MKLSSILSLLHCRLLGSLHNLLTKEEDNLFPKVSQLTGAREERWRRIADEAISFTQIYEVSN